MRNHVVTLTGHQASTHPLILQDELSNLRFKSVDPGGYASASFDLARPLTAKDFDIYSNVSVYRADTGRCVGGGRLLRPGKTLSRSGEVWEVAVLGEGLASTQDEHRPYVLIDDSPERWRQGGRTTKNASWAVGERPDGGEDTGLMLNLSERVRVGARSDMRYLPINEAEQLIGGYRFEFIAGRDSGNNRIFVRAVTRDEGGTATVTNGSGAGQTFDKETLRTHNAGVVNNWARVNDYDVVTLRYERATDEIVPNDDEWAHVQYSRVNALRYDKNGQEILTDTYRLEDQIFAHDVIYDLWTRFCPRLDLAGARVDTGFYGWTELVWPEGVKAIEVMDKLREREAFTWAVWERQPNGLWRAEWRTYDDTVRYDLVADQDVDQYRDVGSDDEVIDTVWVVGSNAKGNPVTERWSFVASPGYNTNVERSKTIQIDSADWSADDGLEKARAERNNASSRSGAATVEVGRLVYDHHTHRYVTPDEIVPGYLCRTRGVPARRINSLNSAITDDRIIARIVSNEHAAETGVSQLELDGVSWSEAQAIVRLLQAAQM
jgi:hypothetical protein